MKMHGTAWLTLVGLGHESGIDILFKRGFSHSTFEGEDLISQRERVTMKKIHFELSHAVFMGKCLKRQPLFFRVIKNACDQFFVFIQGIDTK